MDLQVHLIESLLQVLNMRGGQLDQIVAVTKDYSQRTDLGGRPERSAQ
jgi:hypothetical protein